MKKYIVHNLSGKILRTGTCMDEDFLRQAGHGETVMEGIANDYSQKIVDNRIVDKTPEEIIADNPPPVEIPFEQQFAKITNEQWQDVLNRLSKLETKT